jgi:hypothetical protein
MDPGTPRSCSVPAEAMDCVCVTSRRIGDRGGATYIPTTCAVQFGSADQGRHGQSSLFVPGFNLLALLAPVPIVDVGGDASPAEESR